MEFAEELSIVESWMKDLSVALKVELHLDSEGVCAFQIGEETTITVEVSRDYPMVNIYSSLVSFPSDDVDASVLMMAKALELNAFQSLTRGGAIAAIPGEGILIFCFTMPIEGANSGLFSEILGSFYETVTDLKPMLMQISPVDDKEAKAPAREPGKKPLMMIKI